MITVVSIILIIVYLIILYIGASLMAKSAADKGYGPEAHITAICFWLGIFGYLYALSLPDKTLQKQNEIIQKELTNKRPADFIDELPDL